MPRSVGKQFEDNFKKSAPNYTLSYRPPDSAQGFDVEYEIFFLHLN